MLTDQLFRRRTHSNVGFDMHVYSESVEAAHLGVDVLLSELVETAHLGVDVLVLNHNRV